MADASPKTSNVGPTLWAILLLVCVGLVIGHLILAVETEVKPETNLIERTFISVQEKS